MKIKNTYEIKVLETNGVKLNVLLAGNKEDKLVILLHGFPEFMKGWERQVDDLVDAGYFVLVPDQRGYNKSEKPKSIGAYRIDHLAEDILGLIDLMEKDKAYIAGHDWGANVAWYLGMHHSDRIHKLLIVNVPHSKVLFDSLKKDRKQRRRSWYMFFFQLPVLPQIMLKRKRYKLLLGSILSSANKNTFDKEDIKEYREAWSNNRAVSCMLNWYRAAFRRKSPIKNIHVHCPTLILWGENDKFLKLEMAEKSLKYCDDGSIDVIKDATHWALHEKPKIINPKIIEFFNN